jgi:peptidoglycan/xylan/chitin deacetylase (PgdA/CDA1 family)
MIKQRLRSLRDLVYWTRECLLNQISVPLVVLIYHRVIDLPTDPQQLAVHPDRFRQQLQALKDVFEIRRFEQSWAGLDRPTVVITFDDGYVDNHEYALPILEELGIPATFFITTGYVGSSRELWWDELERVLYCSSGGTALSRIGPVALDRTYDCAKASEREALYHSIHPQLKILDVAERESALADLASAMTGTPEARSSYRVMNVNELVKMAASPMVTLGAHTVSHQPLSSLSVAEQGAEIEDSRTQLCDWIGRPVNVFSYPFGNRGDYTQATVDLCRKAGFTRVAANHAGVVRRTTDPVMVPRFLVRDWPADELLFRLRRFAGL